MAINANDVTAGTTQGQNELFRYDYENIGGQMVRVRRPEIYGWASVHTETGEVALDDFRQFDDELPELVGGWEWKRFTLVPSEHVTDSAMENTEPQKSANVATQNTVSPRSTMSSEAQRIAIAEACGWNTPPEAFGNYTLGGGKFMSSEEWRTAHLPDYLSDLNAMHEAEKIVFDKYDRSEWFRYTTNLENVCGCGGNATHLDYLHATAAQRAEAFLRTLNLWVEEQGKGDLS